ncbi:MAG: hypothetical protein FJ267_19830, partial [Planctomycetes bacterium]|nr:hypothetical protein [Planctomycetota bacterium]
METKMDGHSSQETPQVRRRWFRRASLFVVLFLLIGTCVAGGMYLIQRDSVPNVTTQRPFMGEFATDIVERGELESSANLDLRCEISSSEGVRILEILSEGTAVNPGDVIVQLDDSTLQKDLATQKIAVNTAEAALKKAQNELSAAEIARKEYEEGTYVQDEQKL